MPLTPIPPAGWYEDPEADGLRWWDGERWTEHRRLSSAPPKPPAQIIQPSTGIAPANRRPTPMDVWNGAMAGGRWGATAVLVFLFVGLTIMLVATLGGASSATAETIAAKVIVYGGLGLIVLKILTR